MNTKPTRKKWTRTEWLLLLAPLVIVIGLGAMNFAPQLQRAWREWREYGNNRPYAVFYPQRKGGKTLKPYLENIAFSPDSKHIAVAETLTSGSRFGNTLRIWLWRPKSVKPLYSWLAWEPKGSATYVKQLRYLDNQTISVSGYAHAPSPRHYTQTFFVEKRDTRNGRLISRKQLKNSLESDFSARAETVIPSYYYDIKHCSRQKNGFSVKVWFQETAMPRPKNTAWLRDFKVRVFADVKNQKKRSNYRIPLAEFIDTAENRFHSNKAVQIAFSPDLRFIFLYVKVGQINPDATKFPPQEYIKVFDTQSRKSLWRVDYDAGDIGAVAFSPRGIIAISEDWRTGIGSQPSDRSTRTELRSVQTGELLRVLQNGGISGHANSEHMQFSPDGKLLAVPQDDRLELWDVSDLN